MKVCRGRMLRGSLTGAGLGIFICLIFLMGWRIILDNIVHFGCWFAVILLIFFQFR
jgi:hypothetical protein